MVSGVEDQSTPPRSLLVGSQCLDGVVLSVLLLSNLSDNSINQFCSKTNSRYFLSTNKSFVSLLQTVNIQYQRQPEIKSYMDTLHSKEENLAGMNVSVP